MTQPPSPASSSSYSCVSDSSDTSNDSGVESMSSAGSLHPDYMDIDEFLYASGTEHFSQESPNDFANRFVCQCQENHSPQVQFQQNELKNEVLIYTNNDTELNSKEEVQNKPPEKKESKPKSNSKRQHSGYSYNYNPMPMGKKANRRFVPEEGKDQKYWKRRNKNNEAARRSRDMRRQREIEISAHWKELEKENERLKKELQKLKERANDLEKELLEKQS